MVAERTLVFDGTAPDTGPTRQGLAVSLGAESPAGVWQLVSGTTEGGGAAAVSIANFGTRETTVEVGVLLAGEQTLAPQSVTIPAGGVVAVDVTEHVPVDSAFAVTVTSRDAEGTTGSGRSRAARLVAAASPTHGCRARRSIRSSPPVGG